MVLNFTLVTAFGDLDALAEVTAIGGYRELMPLSAEVMAFGMRCPRANIEPLIRMKRAAGRPKHFEILAQPAHPFFGMPLNSSELLFVD